MTEHQAHMEVRDAAERPGPEWSHAGDVVVPVWVRLTPSPPPASGARPGPTVTEAMVAAAYEAWERDEDGRPVDYTDAADVRGWLTAALAAAPRAPWSPSRGEVVRVLPRAGRTAAGTGTVRRPADDGGARADVVLPDGASTWADVEELVLRVGDTVAADGPIPADGTVVTTRHEVRFVMLDGRWWPLGNTYDFTTGALLEGAAPLIITYLPGGLS